MKNKFVKLLIILIVSSISSTVTYAVQISGKVFGYDENGKPMPLNKARIMLSPSKKGTLTDANGKYNLSSDPNDDLLIVSFAGYKTDSIKISEISSPNDFTIQLKNIMLDAVTVGGEKYASQLSFSDGVKSTTISSRGLLKCACCNLAESFVTPSVDVQYTDAVTGAKRIQLLGLQSVYSQIQDDNMPIMRGLASNYGFSLVPGQWLESISVSKGASTVKNGFESISGLININFKNPHTENPTTLNFYVDDMAHLEFNADHSMKLSEKLGTAFFLHGNYLFNEFDHNSDGFLDKPMGYQLNFSNRWDYQGDSWMNRSGFSVLTDERKGGQVGFHENNSNSNENSNENLWGMNIKTQRYNIFTKNGFMLNENGTNIGTILTFTHHKQNSFFGNRIFNGQQNSFYANIMFQNPFVEEHDHSVPGHVHEEPNMLTVGTSLQYDNFVENFSNDPFSSTVAAANNANIVIPGVFAEYSFTIFHGLKAIAGLRADYAITSNHNPENLLDNIEDKNEEIFLSPRLHLKYNPIEEVLTIAGSVGRGYRIARVIEENAGFLASNREFVISDNLDPEDAWNYGINATWFFDLFGMSSTLNADFYRTDFENQVVADLDKDQNSVHFYNLDGKSYSNAFQIDLTTEVLSNFFVTVAYRRNEVKVTTDGILQDKALQSKNRAFLNFQYNTDMNEWMFDLTVDYNGKGRLPKLDGVISEYDPFVLLAAQVTKSFSDFDIYVGAENIADYMIHNAIKGAGNPFAKGFDASMIYGPVTGRHFYLGLRYKIY